MKLTMKLKKLAAKLTMFYVMMFVGICLYGTIDAKNATAASNRSWHNEDIGDVNIAGSMERNQGRFTLNASGSDIWNEADSFHFAYQQISGDVEIVAYVESMDNTHKWAKAGVMIRYTLNAGSKHAFMCLTPENGANLQYRNSSQRGTSSVPGPNVAAPYWVKLVGGHYKRREIVSFQVGSRTFQNEVVIHMYGLKGYVSNDGMNWTRVGEKVSMPMPDDAVYVGLALTSHDNDLVNTAIMDNVTINNWNYLNIGDVELDGAMNRNGRRITLTASGSDIWNEEDGFNFAYQQRHRNVEIVAYVESMDNTNTWAKAGVMIRETLDAGSRHVFMCLTPERGARLQYRTQTNQESFSIAGPDVSAPYWVKLVRDYDDNTDAYAFKGYVSTDGELWGQVGEEVTMPMNDNIYVGLALTSHDNSEKNTAVMDHIKIISTECHITSEPIETTWRTTTGDFNGDGLQDLVYGHLGRNIEVLYGPDYTCRKTLNPNDHPNNPGHDSFGSSVAAGDIDNDGYSDVVVGMYGKNAAAGAIGVIFGSETGLDSDRYQTFDQDSPGINGGRENGDFFGYSLAVGDFNNDEHDDVAIGVPFENDGEGWVNVIYGANSGLTSEGATIFGQNTDGIDGVGEPGDYFGLTLASGDFNDDGYEDLAIGAPGETLYDLKNTGAINVLYGSASGLSTEHHASFNQHKLRHEGVRPEEDDFFGGALASGDFDGDGCDDLAVGVPGENDQTGWVNILYGTPEKRDYFGGLWAFNNQKFGQNSPGIPSKGESGENFGAELTSGDFNQDGIDDLLIWVKYEREYSDLNAWGWTHVMYGRHNAGLTVNGDRFIRQPWNPWVD